MKAVCLSALFLALAASWAGAQDKMEIQVLPVQGNVYLLATAAGNVTVQVGKTGVLLVEIEGVFASA